MSEWIPPSFSSQKDKLAVIISLMKTEQFIQHRIQGDFHSRIIETIRNVFMKHMKKNAKAKRFISKSLAVAILANPTKQQVCVDVTIEKHKVISVEYPFEVFLKPYMENCLNLDIEEKLDEYIQKFLQHKTFLDKVKEWLLKLWW